MLNCLDSYLGLFGRKGEGPFGVVLEDDVSNPARYKEKNCPWFPSF